MVFSPKNLRRLREMSARAARTVHNTWRRRVQWRGFTRHQRAAAALAWVALLPVVLVAFGWRGRAVHVVVLDDFIAYPWPAACFFGGLAAAVVCVGAGSSPLPRRGAWPAVGLAAAGIPPAVLFAASLERGWATVGLAVGLAAAVLTLATGVAFRRVGWGMVGFALVYLSLALLLGLLIVSGVRRPDVGSLGWYLGLATHQVTYALGYLVFLVVTVTAPIGLLTGTAERHRRVRRRMASPVHRTAFGYGAVFIGLALLLWLVLLDRHRSAWDWLVAALAAIAVIGAVRVTTRRPVLGRDERLAGWWVAATVTLPYAVLAPLLVGGSPDVVRAWAIVLRDWSWALLLAGAAVLTTRRRRATSGVALLLMVAGIEVIRRFGHVTADIKATVCVLVLLVSGLELTANLARRRQRKDDADARSRLALLRAALLALLVVGLLGLIPDGVATQLLFGTGIVLAFVVNLLIDQPGRTLPIPLRGAAYVRAAGWALAMVGAQGVMLAANGLDIANGSQSEAANLLTLPLLVLYAGFRKPEQRPVVQPDVRAVQKHST